jgi:hypothetical protein
MSLPKSIKIGYAVFFDISIRPNCFARIRRSYSTGSRKGSSRSGSGASIDWRTWRRPMPTWRAAGPPASCCSSRRCRAAIVFGGATAARSPANVVFSRSKARAMLTVFFNHIGRCIPKVDARNRPIDGDSPWKREIFRAAKFPFCSPG